jgi:transcriptional regulator with XRE-family HTH domain
MPQALMTTPQSRRQFMIRRARQAKGLTQRELAAMVGTSASRISQLENGCRELDANLAPRLAAVLDIQGRALNTLLGEPDDPGWRQWIWQSRCSPNEKLLLLALHESQEPALNAADLVASTGLPPGTVRALTEALHRRGVLRPVFGPETEARRWAFAGSVPEAA